MLSNGKPIGAHHRDRFWPLDKVPERQPRRENRKRRTLSIRQYRKIERIEHVSAAVKCFEEFLEGLRLHR